MNPIDKQKQKVMLKETFNTVSKGYDHKPLRDMFTGRMSTYGVPKPPQPWKRIATESGCWELF